MHKKLNPLDYANIPLQPRGQSRRLPLRIADYYSSESSYLCLNQEFGSIDPWVGSVRHMRRFAGIFSARNPFLSFANRERVESEAKIGRGYFHTGEISSVFTERSPKARRG